MINGSAMAYPDIKSELLLSCPAIKMMAFANRAIDSSLLAVIEGDMVQADLSLLRGARIERLPLALEVCERLVWQLLL